MDRNIFLLSISARGPSYDIIKSVKTSRNFKAKLRPYQQSGLNWLSLLDSLGFAGCLADDMGLGKTIQVLAFLDILQKKKKNNDSPCYSSTNLLILPASLLSNWESEINKFLPTLNFLIAHPSSMNPKEMKGMSASKIDEYDLIITTYGIAKRAEWIKSFCWSYVILDEAQAVKNPGTAQTKAIKNLKSINRLALTGTPIENGLADLWSLFDFLNPGLLGNRSEFTRFMKLLDEGTKNYGRLRNVIGPYILRRLKTDKSIISDLPDKVEVNSYASLTKKQLVLYQELVDKLERSLIEVDDGEDLNSIQRRGLVLSSLMKFKQICNHPDQYLGQSSYLENESGKLMRLRELCEIIFEKREKVLIFTQFKEVTEMLSRFLFTIFQKEGFVLHGGTSVKRRKQLVEAFQSDEYIPYFILSVKAGGTGLNLTAANHVIHFDRWWNPAVENQATDRAFRIGQKKNVMVHKFITKGTVEDKIALMIEEKSKLVKNVIGNPKGEQWITEMSNSELIDLFKIDRNYL